ncbi:MAG: Rieske 2Fe-2S domain-containing protein [Chloroflexota bacterium]
MLTKAQNDRLTQVGPGTPMGELMRRYWQPLAASSEVNDENPTKEVRLLGEDLILYRDASGTLGLIEPGCPHRKASMAYGIPEKDGLRCCYHGWLFNEKGECVDQPSEPEGSRFKDKVKMKAYPVQEISGLIFAYLGPAPVPVLPKWDLFMWENVERSIYSVMLPCNWLQCHENSLDPVHFQWLHRYYGMWRASRGAMRSGGKASEVGHLDQMTQDSITIEEFDRVSASRGADHLKIGFDKFEYGIIKRRLLEGEQEDSEWWRIGHPILFPNILRVGQENWFEFQCRVPVDDTHTLHIAYTVLVPEDGVSLPKQDLRNIPFEERPAYFPGTKRIKDDYVVGQDQLAWIAQGPITDRTTEMLGVTDVGIIMFRNMLEEQMRIVADGGDPVNVHREERDIIWLPTENAHYPGYKGTGGPFKGATVDDKDIDLLRSLK